MHLANPFLALAAVFTLANARLIVRDNVTYYPPASIPTNGTRYTILDNDWGSTGFIPFLMALGANMKVLGLVSDTANTWVGQTTLHAVCSPELTYAKSSKNVISNEINSWPFWKLGTCPVYLWLGV